MDSLSLRLFLRVADLAGVSAAAHDLGLSPAAASARLAKLESELGARLFTRTTRAVSLTTDGAEFLPYAQACLETLDTGLGVVRGEAGEARGTLRMTMPGSFGRMYVVPLLAEFERRHPRVSLDLSLSDKVLDLVEGAYDLVLRNARLDDSTLISRRLAPDHRLLVASPDYLARTSTPENVRDLSQHRHVTLAGNTRWRFESGASLLLSGATRVNDGEAMRSMLEMGMGIGVGSMWSVHESLAHGRLVPVLPNDPLVTESALWALYPSKRLLPPKVRAMLDFLTEHFSPSPPWNRNAAT